LHNNFVGHASSVTYSSSSFSNLSTSTS
jgi:hypothetical protein